MNQAFIFPPYLGGPGPGARPELDCAVYHGETDWDAETVTPHPVQLCGKHEGVDMDLAISATDAFQMEYISWGVTPGSWQISWELIDDTTDICSMYYYIADWTNKYSNKIPFT